MPGITLQITEALAPATPEIKLYPEISKEQRAPVERWFMRLSYRGAGFCGWQRQPASPSVQQAVEEALATVMRHPVAITGAGRTDTGVNARVMWAHFDAAKGEVQKENLMRSLNHLLGKNIAVHELRRVRPDAHARFDALSRTYRYFIVYEKSPFLNGLTWRCPARLDLDKMNEASALLLRTDDFTSFAKLHSDARTNICNVTEARWDMLTEDPETRAPVEGVIFTVTADRFLRNMVRALVGTLTDVGRGKLSVDDFSGIIASKDRCSAGQSMPGEALFLWDIRYPDNIWTED